MKKLLLAVSLLLATLTLIAQSRTVSGRLTSSEDGGPLPGVNVTIKGTSIGTVTDADGNYSIVAPIGSTLVFSFIGMTTREMLVTAEGVSVQRRPILPHRITSYSGYDLHWVNSSKLVTDTAKSLREGIAVLGRNTGRILNAESVNPEQVQRIQKIGNNFLLHVVTTPSQIQPLIFQFSSTLGIEAANRWPAMQTKYAQGQSMQWRGPETGEVFSYGPLIRSLEFDGSNYPFDRNGRLVAPGNGTGTPAKTYQSLEFFNTVLNSTTQLSASVQARRGSRIYTSVGRFSRNGIIPTTLSSAFDGQIRYKSSDVSDFRMEAFSWWRSGRSRLAPHGANIANIISSALTTPATFDNTNGFGRNAIFNEQSWTQADGSPRTHAVNAADNPYELAKRLPDEDTHDHNISYLKLLLLKPVEIGWNIGLDYQKSSASRGYLPGTVASDVGRRTDRRVTRQYISSDLHTTLSSKDSEWQRKLTVAVLNQLERVRLSRVDEFGVDRTDYYSSPADTRVVTDRVEERLMTEVSGSGEIDWEEKVKASASIRSYFSNTLRAVPVLNLFPYLSAQTDLARFCDCYPLSKFLVYTSVARNLREAPLLWSDWSFNSSSLSLSEGLRFYEQHELVFSQARVQPETEIKLNAGFKARVRRFDFDVEVYRNETRNLIVPGSPGTSDFELINGADIRNRGASASVEYYFHFSLPYGWNSYRSGYVTVRHVFGNYHSTVLNTYGPSAMIPLAGFREVAAVLAKGEPFGAIFGTSYARSASGDLLIDSDGFPYVDPTLRKIGDPIPKWTGGTDVQASAGQLRLWFTLDYRVGGDRWNGTSRALDYYGVSAATGDQRTISGFVFEGLQPNGTRNTTPVTFSGQPGDVTSNRWVRDGLAGAADQYIEDASWLRISRIGLGFELLRSKGRYVKGMSIEVEGKNLLLYTAYSGMDPTTSLFANRFGEALDFFNQPGLRSFHTSLKLTF